MRVNAIEAAIAISCIRSMSVGTSKDSFLSRCMKIIPNTGMTAKIEMGTPSLKNQENLDHAQEEKKSIKMIDMIRLKEETEEEEREVEDQTQDIEEDQGQERGGDMKAMREKVEMTAINIIAGTEETANLEDIENIEMIQGQEKIV